MNRRTWLRTAGGILAAPAVVRAESIMRVRPVVDELVSFPWTIGGPGVVLARVMPTGQVQWGRHVRGTPLPEWWRLN